MLAKSTVLSFSSAVYNVALWKIQSGPNLVNKRIIQPCPLEVVAATNSNCTSLYQFNLTHLLKPQTWKHSFQLIAMASQVCTCTDKYQHGSKLCYIHYTAAHCTVPPSQFWRLTCGRLLLSSNALIQQTNNYTYPPSFRYKRWRSCNLEKMSRMSSFNAAQRPEYRTGDDLLKLNLAQQHRLSHIAQTGDQWRLPLVHHLLHMTNQYERAISQK
jgi:hypothetical protein